MHIHILLFFSLEKDVLLCGYLKMAKWFQGCIFRNPLPLVDGRVVLARLRQNRHPFFSLLLAMMSLGHNFGHLQD